MKVGADGGGVMGLLPVAPWVPLCEAVCVPLCVPLCVPPPMIPSLPSFPSLPSVDVSNKVV